VRGGQAPARPGGAGPGQRQLGVPSTVQVEGDPVPPAAAGRGGVQGGGWRAQPKSQPKSQQEREPEEQEPQPKLQQE